jgi:hypothetical protein
MPVIASRAGGSVGGFGGLGASVVAGIPDTLTYKTVMAKVGFADGSANQGHNNLISGAWLNLQAIRTITLSCPNATSWVQYSKASLYGILGTGSSASFDSIATAEVGAGTTPTIEFTNIPSTYKDLQIRAVLRTNRASVNSDAVTLRFNGDTGSNYVGHRLEFSGTNEDAYSDANASGIILNRITATDAPADVFGLAIIDIQNVN